MLDGKSALRLDIGCGTQKKPGYTGMDSIPFEGVDIVHDARITPWPFEDNSVDSVVCSHFLEHLTNAERIGFFNELGRVMKVGALATIITPHWTSERAYGDPTHQWPAVTMMAYCYLDSGWRKANAPHVGFTCHFNCDFVETGDDSGKTDLIAVAKNGIPV
jgi:ubiquinone/menaquinone biosynthesis C-methylase UbiE